jgi:hypothetical protein
MKGSVLVLVVAVLLVGAVAAQTAPAPGANAAGQRAGLLNFPPTNDPSAQTAQRLLVQMVEALGGQAYLNIQDMEQSGRTYGFFHGEASGTGMLFHRLWKWPAKERIEMTKQRDWYTIYNGDKGYDVTFRGTAAVEDEVVEDYVRRRNHSLQVVLREWLRAPGAVVLHVGQALAERHQTEEVSILTAQDDSVSIFVDTDSHLPRRVSFVWRDPKTRDRTEEAEGYDNYRLVQGIMTPFSVTRYRDGLTVNQRFITETKYNQNPPDSLFNATVTWNPKHSGPMKKK